MRKFNFNKFSKNTSTDEKPSVKKSATGAYRTIISRHEAAAERLKNEPTAEITRE